MVAQSTGVVTMGSDLQGQGGFSQLRDPTQWDLTPDASHTAGQATAIGISAGGISAKQLDTLKTRLENTKTQLQANNLQNFTGEQISGDLLTATIWSWFAAADSHNPLSQNQAGIIENPGLSYGLFHAVANPISSWGVVRKVTFPGVNIDIGHIRNVSWAKDNDDKKWVAYNRLRGEYMSALEHSVLEKFFSDLSFCSPTAASEPFPGRLSCPRSVSAIKALAVAGEERQKIYKITQAIYQENPQVVSAVFGAHSFDTQSRIQQALDAGQEVVSHERPINAFGWTGAGYVAIDIDTGAGAYRIEGGSNGAELTTEEMNRIVNLQGLSLGIGLTAATLAMLLAAGSTLLAPAASLMVPVLAIVAAVAFASMLTILLIESEGDARGCMFQGINITTKVFLARVVATLLLRNPLNPPTVVEKILALLGVGYSAADPFIPDTPVQNCVL